MKGFCEVRKWTHLISREGRRTEHVGVKMAKKLMAKSISWKVCEQFFSMGVDWSELRVKEINLPAVI